MLNATTITQSHQILALSVAKLIAAPKPLVTNAAITGNVHLPIAYPVRYYVILMRHAHDIRQVDMSQQVAKCSYRSIRGGRAVRHGAVTPFPDGHLCGCCGARRIRHVAGHPGATVTAATGVDCSVATRPRLGHELTALVRDRALGEHDRPVVGGRPQQVRAGVAPGGRTAHARAVEGDPSQTLPVAHTAGLGR